MRIFCLKAFRSYALGIGLTCFLACQITASTSLLQSRDIRAGTVLEFPIDSVREQVFRLELKAGESARVDVLQMGTDVVIDVSGPDGRLLDSIDGPTGRSGAEKVEVFSSSPGYYTLRIHAFDDREPAGRFRLTVRFLRNARETRRVVAERSQSIRLASEWLRPRSRGFTLSKKGIRTGQVVGLHQLLSHVRVVGLGEATHGSKEFNDVRLAFTKELVEECGFRVIAIEFSASRARELIPYAAGQPFSPEELKRHVDSIWIGSRIRHALYVWVRSWNLAHPKDPVTIIGVDAGDNGPSRTRLFAFLQKAYGLKAAAQWNAIERELREADAQTTVFGDAGVDTKARTALMEVQIRLMADRPLLETRFGDKEVARALEAARTLFEFSDFNAGGGTLNQSRDWYMAMGVLRTIKAAGPKSRAVYWAHNAHVAATAGSFKTTGSLLREALGQQYCPLAATSGTGTFVAQVPNDPEDRLRVSSFLPHLGDTVEDILSRVRPGLFLAYWRGSKCPPSLARLLTEPQPMHWIGGLFAPLSPPSSQYRTFRLIRDFDGVIYVPTVVAETLPPARPIVPARKRVPLP